MCTALTLTTKEHYFGRTLDLDCSYGEEVCIMPRRYPLVFRKLGKWDSHYAMIGMATVVGEVPLYYDGVNEYGLAMAGLNFPGNAYYGPLQEGWDNVAPFEFIPWILCQCKTVAEAEKLLRRMNLANIPFSEALPPSPLHWMIADRDRAVVVEVMADGMHIYDNPTGVMTNNPPFPFHLQNLNNYRRLTVDNGENLFADTLALDNYCQGLGAVGLPGDVSSMSRFVRASFGRAHSVCGEDENSSVSQFFHLLGSVEMNRGICRTPQEHWDITVYTSCMNMERGLYYYTTYDNRQICCVDMHQADLDGTTVSRFALAWDMVVRYING